MVKKKPMSKVQLPVISGPDRLPLLDPNFTWENFEKFSKQLIEAIYNECEVNLCGVKGQKQYGIDLIAKSKDGSYFFAQNKKHKKYSVAQFKEAKEKTNEKPEVKGTKIILLLACEASADLRFEVLHDPHWEIWDVNDISDKVLQLKSEIRKDLVKRYFGVEWAKAFSDYNEFSSIVSPINFFRNFFDSKKLFNHTVPFLGRNEELSYLKKFIERDNQALVLTASGGVGKSRLLWEFSEKCVDSGWSFLFIKEGMNPLADHFQSIKSDKVIFIFDDAHRFDPAPYLAFIYALKNVKFKIIFSTRPQGKEKLKLDLNKNNLESSEIQDYEIKKFIVNDAKPLVSKLLPKIEASHVWPIANLFADSTLVGVLACNLIKRKSVSLANLSSESDIKGIILSRFTEELSGKIESKKSNDLIHKILDYISALAPIEYDKGKIDSKFISATEEKKSDINECIADLLYSGVIIERGGRIRISPDVLSDCILERACYLKNGNPSDFFKNLFEKVDGELRNNLLKNISELDWRKKETELTNSVLLSEFWSKFKNTSSDDLSVLEGKLEIIKSIAYFQPVESYEALLNSIKTLSKLSTDEYDYSFCMRYIVDICRSIILTGYNVEEMMMTLWEHGKGDERRLNLNPKHPIRSLSDLCSYEKNFPIVLYEKTLKGLKAIVEKYDSKNDYHNPISILGGFLEKNSILRYPEGHTITIRPVIISYKNTKKIRLEVFEILKKLALSGDLKTSYLAVKEISNAVTPPQEMMGSRITKTQLKVWDKEIGDAINLLIEVYKKTKFNLIKIHIKNNLNNKIRRNKQSHKTVISNFIRNNPFTIDELKYAPFEFRYYKEILIQKDFKDYEEKEIEEEKVYKRITKNIVLKLKTPKKILKYTEDVVSELLTVSDSFNSLRFSSILSELIDSREMCEALLENNSNKIEHDFGVFLKKIGNHNLDMALQYVQKSIDLNNQVIIKSIAESFWWIFEGYESNQNVITYFEKLFKHSDEDVRLSSLHGIKILISQKQRDKAIKYLMAFNVSSLRSMVALFELINPYCIKFDELTDDQLSELLVKIKDIEDLSDDRIDEFISECGKKIPIELFEILLYRVKSKKNQEEKFTPLPYLGFENLNLKLSDEDTLKVFSKISDALKEEDTDTFWIPTLFYDLAKGKCDLAISYLTNLIKSDDIETVGVGTNLLRKFNNSLVFSRQEWVRDLLNHGKNKDNQFFNEIKDGLLRLGIPMEKNGPAGQSMPQDTALVKNSITAAAKATSDCEKQFYTELKEHGKKEIAKTMKKNQRFLDD